jgi:hypothetical protein
MVSSRPCRWARCSSTIGNFKTISHYCSQ